LLVPAIPDGLANATEVFESLVVFNGDAVGRSPQLYWGEVLGKRFMAQFGAPPAKRMFPLTVAVDELPEPVVHLLANTLTADHCSKAELSGINIDWAGTAIRFEGEPFDGGWSVKTECREKLELE